MIKMQKFIEKATTLCFAGMMAVILFVLFFLSKTPYYCRPVYSGSNVGLAAVSFGITGAAAGVILLLKRKGKWKGFPYEKTVRWGTLVLFLFQCYLAYNIRFETEWDVGYAILPSARAIAAGKKEEILNWYFSQYQNNMFLTAVYSLILRLNARIGIFTGQDELMCIVLVNAVINSAVCRLTFQTARRFIREGFAFLAYLLTVLLVGISPWFTICYSDSFGLFFPLLSLFLYTGKGLWTDRNAKDCDNKGSLFRQGIRFCILCILGYLGYLIKPQTVILLIAIVIVESSRHFRKMSLKKALCILGFFAGACLCIGTIRYGLEKMYDSMGFQTESEKKFGITHYLMMGLNPQTNGVYSEEDVQTSMDCKDTVERRQTNLRISKERMEAFGLTGFLEHWKKKILINYNDGTFAWSMEGGFYDEIYEPRNSVISGLLREVYYNSGKYYRTFYTVEQSIWLLVLGLSLFTGCMFFQKEYEKKDTNATVLQLAVIGLTLFELLFEARARYLYTYAPIYALLAAAGAEQILWIRKRCRALVDRVSSGVQEHLQNEDENEKAV